MVPLQALENKTVGGDNASCEIVARAEGWFVLTADGESIGPFAALREVEDWLDARSQQRHKPKLAAE